MNENESPRKVFRTTITQSINIFLNNYTAVFDDPQKNEIQQKNYKFMEIRHLRLISETFQWKQQFRFLFKAYIHMSRMTLRLMMNIKLWWYYKRGYSEKCMQVCVKKPSGNINKKKNSLSRGFFFNEDYRNELPQSKFTLLSAISQAWSCM